jgi:hypothetical protein
LVCVGRPNPSNPSITFGEQRQDPLSPTDAEALMAVVLSSAHHDINSPRIQTFEAASEFWLVLESSGFLPVSNLEFPGKSFQIRCQNICRWGLQSSLKPGNKAFSLPLAWTWSGFPRVFAVVFQRSGMIKLKIKCFEGFHIPNLPFVEAKLPPKTIQTSSTCIKKPSNNYSKNQKRSHMHMSEIFSSHFPAIF